MGKMTLRSLTVALALIATQSVYGGLDKDEIPPADGKMVGDVVAAMRAQGLKAIVSVEYDNSVWTAETLENGVETHYSINPKTLKVQKTGAEKEDDVAPGKNGKTIEDVIKIAEAKHRGVIREVSFDDGKWEVSCVKDGREWELEINAATGEVVKDQIDD